jgi:predicted unusual protein kinase regulating ubiquinone biosynthesis (AarF/ABC1/UbiB family)
MKIVRPYLPNNHSVQVLKTTCKILYKTSIQKTTPAELGAWLVKEFQALGPTYVKIGQFISSRQDIFSVDFAKQFEILQDKTTPMSDEELQEALTHIPSTYHISPDPIASASIGQVHMATRLDKPQQKLIVKLKRPNISKRIKSELGLLKQLVSLLAHTSMPNIDHTITLLDDFEEYLSAETNLLTEARNLELFQDVYKGSRFNHVIPKLFEKAPDYLIMEYIPNIGNITNYTGDRMTLAKDLMNFFVAQLIDYGVLHGDPHKGNVTVTPEGQIVLYDFGALLEFSKEERYLMKELVYMLIIGNKYAICKILEKLGATIDDTQALEKYIDLYILYVQTLDIDIFRSQAGMSSSNTALPIRLNGRLIRLLRVFGTLEGICKELDPDFNYYLLINNYIASLVADEEFIRWKITHDELLLRRKFKNSLFKIFSM